MCRTTFNQRKVACFFSSMHLLLLHCPVSFRVIIDPHWSKVQPFIHFECWTFRKFISFSWVLDGSDYLLSLCDTKTGPTDLKDNQHKQWGFHWVYIHCDMNDGSGSALTFSFALFQICRLDRCLRLPLPIFCCSSLQPRSHGRFFQSYFRQ